MPYVDDLENRTSYDTFGRVWTSTTPSVESRFAFTGRDLDPESDLYHYRARYYDPATGQFISADPIGFEAGDGNLYRYVDNGPIDGTDPMGLFGPKLKLFTFEFNGREYTYGFTFTGPFPLAYLSGTSREDGLEAESGLIRDFADEQKDKNSPLAVVGLLVVPAALFDGTIPHAIHRAASDSRSKILVRIAQGDEGEQAAGIVAYEIAWIGEGFAQYGALESAVGPVRAMPLAPGAGAGRRTVYTVQDDISEIWRSQRAWGQTEGSVYGMEIPNAPRMRTMVDPPTRDPGTVIFRENAAELFTPHEVWGPFSGLKRLLGQQKAGFGDVIFDDAYKVGNRIFVYEAHVGTHAGQLPAEAATRLWQRRAFDLTTDGVIIIGGVNYALKQD